MRMVKPNEHAGMFYSEKVRLGQDDADCVGCLSERSGADICDLIKTTDLDLQYDCLAVCDEAGISCPDDPEPFSYDRCHLAVKRRMKLWISDDFGSGIGDSPFCEHTYVVDLDTGQLQYYFGGQTQPQRDNPYGTQPVKPFGMDKEYYPCRLARVISFEYIRTTSIDRVVEDMERIDWWDTSDIQYFMEPVPCNADQCVPGWGSHMTRMMLEIEATAAQLEIMRRMIPELHPLCERRARELEQDYLNVSHAVKALQKRIEILK